MTKKEFLELSQKYSGSEYNDKAVIIGNEFPKRFFVVKPFDRVFSKSAKRHILEFTNDDITYYGQNGNVIKGEFDQVLKNITIEGCDTVLNFYKYCSHINVYELKCVFESWFNQIIEKFHKFDISIDGLRRWTYRIQECYLKKDIDELIILPIKDLRDLQKFYNGPAYWNIRTKINILKRLFGRSTKDICKYITPSGYCYLDNSCFATKEARKKCIRDISYYTDLISANINIYIYRDYLRLRGLIPTELVKNFPKYPKDVSRIYTLHDQCLEIFNRESDRRAMIIHSKAQENYDKHYYNFAKKLEFSNDIYSIIACKDLEDLLKEGRVLNHCVGSYIQSVGEGKEYILFLRKNNELDKPFYTIDVTKSLIVRQIHGSCNCNLTDDLKPFISEWAKKFNLNLSNCNSICNHM